MHTFSRVLPLGFYALWVRSGTLALEVLQKKKLMTPLVRECHFWDRHCNYCRNGAYTINVVYFKNVTF